MKLVGTDMYKYILLHRKLDENEKRLDVSNDQLIKRKGKLKPEYRNYFVMMGDFDNRVEQNKDQEI